MPVTANPALTLTIATTDVRQDLLDTDATAYRWTDPIVQRQLDRSVERYSTVAPLLLSTQLSTYQSGRIYASPASPGYNVDRVEYPLHQWPRRFHAFKERYSPKLGGTTTNPIAADGGAGAILAGSYLYIVSFAVPGTTGPGTGEFFPLNTTGTYSNTALTIGANRQIALTSIPTGPEGVSTRYLYRCKVGGLGGPYYYLATLADNVTTTYTDNTPDASLSATTSTGNNTSDGLPQIEVDLRPGFLPADGTDLIEVTYTAKHVLDSTGTTIPERHWDVITLGAEYFLTIAAATSTNDNFDYVDGQFRDRVDDRSAPAAWLNQARHLEEHYHRRLAQIRDERTASITNITQWGDQPRHWDRI